MGKNEGSDAAKKAADAEDGSIDGPRLTPQGRSDSDPSGEDATSPSGEGAATGQGDKAEG